MLSSWKKKGVIQCCLRCFVRDGRTESLSTGYLRQCCLRVAVSSLAGGNYQSLLHGQSLISLSHRCYKKQQESSIARTLEKCRTNPQDVRSEGQLAVDAQNSFDAVVIFYVFKFILYDNPSNEATPFNED